MDDPLLHMPGYLLRRASAVAFAGITERLAPLGVRPIEASVLTLIAGNAGVTQSDIGTQLGIQRANMTPLIARMAEQGWVGREPLDGRSQALTLTPAGVALQQAIWTEIERYEAGLVAAVPAEHRVHLIPVLTALWRHRG